MNYELTLQREHQGLFMKCQTLWVKKKQHFQQMCLKLIVFLIAFRGIFVCSEM